MKKLLEFFSGKSTQISIISVALCLVIAVSAGVAIHNNNKRVDNALNALSSTSTTEGVSESTGETETSTESTTETTSKKQNKTTTTVTEPAGDRTAQYIAEYDKITREYEKKRSELANQLNAGETATKAVTTLGAKPTRRIASYGDKKTQEEYDKEYASRLVEWEAESVSIEHNISEIQRIEEEAKQKTINTQKQIDELDVKYEKDIENLKREHGIIE